MHRFRNRSLFVVAAITLLVACSPPASPPGSPSIGTPEPSPAVESTGGSHVAGAPARLVRASTKGQWATTGLDYQQRVANFVRSADNPIPVSDVNIIEVEQGAAGTDTTFVLAQQRIGAYLVDGHQLRFTLEGDTITSVRGYYIDARSFEAAKLTEAEAVAIALTHAKMAATGEGAPSISADKVIREVDTTAHLTWKVLLDTMVTKPVIYVDAYSGDVVHQSNLVRHGTGVGNRLSTDDEDHASVTPAAISFGAGEVLNRKGKLIGHDLTATGLGLGSGASVRTLEGSSCRGGAFICGDDVITTATDGSGNADFSGVDARYTTAHHYVSQVLAFLADYGIDSYDGAGSDITVYAYRDGEQYDNAFYGGSNYIVLGDGSYDEATGTGSWTPLVHAGVIFHELGHAVDSGVGSGYAYEKESGALSESWADMQGYRGRQWLAENGVLPGDVSAHVLGADFTPGNWHNEEGCGDSGVAPASADCGSCGATLDCGDGACVDNEVCGGAGLASPATECASDCGSCTGGAPVEGDGICDRGQDIGGDGHHAYLRNMQDPMQNHQPDTYQGEYWVAVDGCTPSDTNDGCGVHTNSGVGNKWFTTVANALGSDVAYRIALDTVDHRSTATDKYIDFADGTVAAAAALYDAATVAVVESAWRDVGVYSGCTTDAECDDGDACTGAETCVGGSCVAGTAVSCDDSNACTDDTCNPADGACSNDATTCDDGDACNGAESCDPALGCQGGSAVDCSDGDACTDDSCDPGTGACSNPATSCDDGDSCTVDVCDGASGCGSTAVGCVNDDGCCTAGCDAASDNDCTACANTGDSCVGNGDCCSGACSKGKPSTRTCQ